MQGSDCPSSAERIVERCSAAPQPARSTVYARGHLMRLRNSACLLHMWLFTAQTLARASRRHCTQRLVDVGSSTISLVTTKYRRVATRERRCSAARRAAPAHRAIVRRLSAPLKSVSATRAEAPGHSKATCGDQARTYACAHPEIHCGKGPVRDPEKTDRSRKLSFWGPLPKCASRGRISGSSGHGLDAALVPLIFALEGESTFWDAHDIVSFGMSIHPLTESAGTGTIGVFLGCVLA